MQNSSFVSNLYNGISKRIAGLFYSPNKKAGLNWVKEKFLKHASAGKTRVYFYKGNKIYYSSPSEFLHSMKEIFVSEIYKIELPDSAFIIDCGANIGISTLYLKQICPTAEILAFEPDETNYKLLLKNIESFNLKKVTAQKEAVWKEDTYLQFASDGTMGSRIDVKKDSSNTITVKTFRLRNILDRKVSFLKMDIEGAEYEVLKDISSLLPNIDNLFVEYHGKFNQINQLTEIFSLVNKAGFSYYIKEAANVYTNPFIIDKTTHPIYDIQLNIFCFRTK